MVGGGPADGRRAGPAAAPRSAPPGPRVPVRWSPGPRSPCRPRPQRASAGHRPGRVRRFVLRYGWRAYAIPLLSSPRSPSCSISRSPRRPAHRSAAGRRRRAVHDVGPHRRERAHGPGRGRRRREPRAAGGGEETYVETGAGTLSVVDGSSEVMGTGPLKRFIVEVEDGIDVDGPVSPTPCETTLGDPRSWGNGGRMSFQRVGADGPPPASSSSR